jgi:4-hydroxy-tetrahydrodipicolinate reductase
MRILLSGFNGAMGREVIKLAETGYQEAQIAAGVDINAAGTETFAGQAVPVARSFEEASTDVDVIVDFSHHSLTSDLVKFAVDHGIRLVLATTGQTDEEKAMIREAGRKIPLFFTANYSMGIAILIELAKKTASLMPDAEVEIVEVHHDRKIDAPSGTALAIAEGVKEVRPGSEIVCGRSGMKKREHSDIGVSSVRIGNVVGIHEVLIGTNNQTISLKHEAHSRALFAEGALSAAAWLMKQPAGLYDMNDLIR